MLRAIRVQHPQAKYSLIYPFTLYLFTLSKPSCRFEIFVFSSYAFKSNHSPLFWRGAGGEATFSYHVSIPIPAQPSHHCVGRQQDTTIQRTPCHRRNHRRELGSQCCARQRQHHSQWSPRRSRPHLRSLFCPRRNPRQSRQRPLRWQAPSACQVHRCQTRPQHPSPSQRRDGCTRP